MMPIDTNLLRQPIRRRPAPICQSRQGRRRGQPLLAGWLALLVAVVAARGAQNLS